MIFVSCLIVLLCTSVTHAFDTGHHFDATRNALLIRNFNPGADAINIAQLQNFAADWNSLGKVIKFPNFKTVHEQTNLLHFNSLYNSTMVRKYWIQLWNNTYHTARSIVQSNGFKIGTQEPYVDIKNQTLISGKSSNMTFPLLEKEFLLLSLLGLTLHAHQDFYTHSNWITAQRKPNGDVNVDDGGTVREFTEVPSSDCYYAAGSYDPLQKNDYNLHTYYYPETDSEKERIEDQYNYGELIKHGGYYDGINKDAYNKVDFDFSYVNAVMQSIDTIDTFQLWINELDDSKTIWNNMLNYTLKRKRDIDDLHFGTEKLFSVSAYVKLAWWQTDSTSGHWKGEGSGDTTETIQEAGYAFSGFQDTSIFQSFVWNTNVLDILTYHIERIDRVDNLPMFPESMIPTIMPQRVRNDPSNFKAVIVKTHQVTREPFKSSSSNNWQGLYAVIGIEGQFFRETPLYNTELYPWWQSIRVIEKDINRISISYDLAIWTDDNEDREKLANISPYTLFIKPFVNLFYMVKDYFSGDNSVENHADHSAMKGEVLVSMNQAGGQVQDRLKSRFKTQELNLDRFAISLSGAEREAIEADVIVNQTGVFFLYDATQGTIISGLPTRYIDQRVDQWPDHQLVLQASSNNNAARVNVTIHTRQLCKANYVTGTLGFAPVANTTYNSLFPNAVTPPNQTPQLGGAYTTFASNMLVVACMFAVNFFFQRN